MKSSKFDIFHTKRYINQILFCIILLRSGIIFKIRKGLLTWNRRRWLRIERNRSIALLPHEGLHSVQCETVHRASLLFDRLHRALVLRADGFLAACWASRPS